MSSSNIDQYISDRVFDGKRPLSKKQREKLLKIFEEKKKQET